ncbi:hypothetical protein FSARC_7521 [Fusarium sarcochroum]|uniref:SCP domain-containing protein n=1 Tax=Fusarium sarcochroum TaxID=1208366 RepID=A0A8H4X786_9HYPO|nr:hypothetical protein FSARC_7521 [Fusarium sarcochroum]
MHYSTLIASTMMAATAMAAPHRDWQHQRQNVVIVTEYEVVTHVATAGAAAPVQTYVPQQPEPVAEEPQAVEVKPTTVKKVQKKKVQKTTAAAAPKQTAEEETGSSSGSSGLTADQQKAVDLHNEARKAVGNDALEWDDSLVSGAQEWAEHLVSLGSLEHSQGEDGENLYQGYGDTPFADAVEAFLSEKSSYNGEAISGSNYMGFGHYTQCVWKTTTKVGMASAKGNDGAVYVVARYQKPGNMIGDTPY